jgi:hypothetical protein
MGAKYLIPHVGTLKPVSIVYLTGGSSATRGRYSALRAAGATAREMLINAGTRPWSIAS